MAFAAGSSGPNDPRIECLSRQTKACRLARAGEFMSIRRRLRSPFVALVVAIALVACSSAPGTTPVSNPLAQARHPNGEGTHLFITFHNNVDAFTLVTRYWSDVALSTWHVEGTNCVSPGQTIGTNIAWGQGSPEAKLRVDVKGKQNCQGSTLRGGDIVTEKCTLKSFVSDLYSEVKLTGSLGQFELSKFLKVPDREQPCKEQIPDGAAPRVGAQATTQLRSAPRIARAP
jgi:hypothetical protein